MLCMLKHTLFSCVYAKGVFSIHSRFHFPRGREGKGGEGISGIGTLPPRMGREGKGMEGRMAVGG